MTDALSTVGAPQQIVYQDRRTGWWFYRVQPQDNPVTITRRFNVPLSHWQYCVNLNPNKNRRGRGVYANFTSLYHGETLRIPLLWMHPQKADYFAADRVSYLGETADDCPAGSGRHWDDTAQACVNDDIQTGAPPAPTCGPGEVLDTSTNQCVSACGAGTHWDTNANGGQGGCVADAPPPATDNNCGGKGCNPQSADFDPQTGQCIKKPQWDPGCATGLLWDWACSGDCLPDPNYKPPPADKQPPPNKQPPPDNKQPPPDNKQPPPDNKQPPPPTKKPAATTGMSTGAKIALALGAAGLAFVGVSAAMKGSAGGARGGARGSRGRAPVRAPRLAAHR